MRHLCHFFFFVGLLSSCADYSTTNNSEVDSWDSDCEEAQQAGRDGDGVYGCEITCEDYCLYGESEPGEEDWYQMLFDCCCAGLRENCE